MSLTRRLAAGLPAAGVTAFAAFAFTGVPAMAATADASGLAARPAVMASPCADSSRDQCDYSTTTAAPGSDDATTPGDDAAVGNGDDNGYGDTGTNSGSGTGTGTGTGAGTGNQGTRGHHTSGGYGGVSPTTVPPTGNTDTVPPGGEAPTTTPATPGGGGVSPAGTLPVTGPSMGLTAGLGGALVLAGAGAFWFSRRRRTA
jgi:LPXTG-motif cell wall-anchored protein